MCTAFFTFLVFVINVQNSSVNYIAIKRISTEIDQCLINPSHIIGSNISIHKTLKEILICLQEKRTLMNAYVCFPL